MRTGEVDLSAHPTFRYTVWETVRHVLIARAKQLGPAIPLLVVAGLVISPILDLPRTPLSVAAWVVAALGYSWFWLRLALSAEEDVASAYAGMVGAKTMLAAAARHRAKHDEAMAIVYACDDETKLFALLLRNFDSEVYGVVTPERAGEERRFIQVITLGRRWERTLSQALHPLSLIKIANRADVHAAADAVPAVLLDSEAWREQVATLIARAALIVVDLDHESDSIAYELATILEQRKEHVTVVVLPSDPSGVEVIYEGVKAAAPHLSMDFPPPPPLPDEWIARFPRVVREDEIPYDDLRNCPAFASLLDEITALGALSSDERRKRVTATALQGEGMSLSRQVRIDEALAAFQQCAALYEELDDRPAIEGTYRYMAALHCCAGDDEAAARNYLRARRVEEPEKTSAGDLDEMRRILAVTLLGQGNPKCSLRILNRAVEAQRDEPPDKRLPMLYTLANVHAREGSGADAARVLCEIASAEHSLGRIETACQAYCDAAKQTAMAGDLKRATSLLADASAVADELGDAEASARLHAKLAASMRIPPPR